MNLHGLTQTKPKQQRMNMKIKSEKMNMKPLNLILATVLTICVAFADVAQAVVPAPEGGYPRLNTAEGQNALLSLTTGQGNTAVGWFSLKSNTEGSFNTGVGAGTLLFDTGD